MVSSDAILAMKAMAADPKKRPILIKDPTCIGGLVIVLSNQDPEIVTLSLETLLLLAECTEYRHKLRDFIGMMDQLDVLRSQADCHGNIQNLAERLHNLLTGRGFTTPLKDTANISCNNTLSRRVSSTHGHHSCKSKTLILQLRGLMNKCDRDVCMRLLLQVKGVISITFDLNKKRCVLRTKPDIKPETLVHAVAKTQSIYAQQVVKNQSGEELFLSFGTNERDMDKENEPDLPDYLPDDGDSPVIDDKAIARNKGDRGKGGSWLSTAASYLTNSFYW